MYSTSPGGSSGSGTPSGGPAIKFRELYSYTPAGLLLGKRLWSKLDTPDAVADTLDGSYTYDDEGRMTSQTYPSAQPAGGGADVLGEVFSYGFDVMGRPDKMGSDAQNNANTWINGITYNALALPTKITAGTNGQAATEDRTYNELGQLTKIAAGPYEFGYSFSGSANDGRITSQSTYANSVLQETINGGIGSPWRTVWERHVTGSGSIADATVEVDGGVITLGLNPDYFNHPESINNLFVRALREDLPSHYTQAAPYIEQGATLIHELGHIFNAAPYFGGSRIQNDAGNSIQSGNNQAIVYNNCVRPIFPAVRTFDEDAKPKLLPLPLP